MGRRGLHRKSLTSFTTVSQRVYDSWDNHEVFDPIQKGVGSTRSPELQGLAGQLGRAP